MAERRIFTNKNLNWVRWGDEETKLNRKKIFQAQNSLENGHQGSLTF